MNSGNAISHCSMKEGMSHQVGFEMYENAHCAELRKRALCVQIRKVEKLRRVVGTLRACRGHREGRAGNKEIC